MANPASDVLNSLRVARAKNARSAGGAVGGGGLGGGVGAGGSDAVAPDPSISFSSTPDFKNLIAQDPSYLYTQQGVQGANLDAASARTAAVRHLLAQYGTVPNLNGLNVTDPSDPSGRGFLDQDVDATTRDLAAQNDAAGTSVLGQLGYSHSQNLSNLRALMAARGILGSGQDSLVQADEGHQYAGQVDTAQSSLFDALHQAQQDYLAQYRTGQQQQAQALMDTTNRLQASGVGDSVKTTANLDPAFTSNGAPVYKDSGGNYWGANGKAVSANDLTTTAPAQPSVGHSAAIDNRGVMV